LRFQSLGNGAMLDLSAQLWSMDGLAHAMWPKNLRRVVCMMCVSGGWSVRLLKFAVCDANTTDQMRHCFSTVDEWLTMFLLTANERKDEDSV